MTSFFRVRPGSPSTSGLRSSSPPPSKTRRGEAPRIPAGLFVRGDRGCRGVEPVDRRAVAEQVRSRRPAQRCKMAAPLVLMKEGSQSVAILAVGNSGTPILTGPGGATRVICGREGRFAAEGVFATERRFRAPTFSPWQKLPRQQIVPRGRILLASLREKITPTPNKTAKEARVSKGTVDYRCSSPRKQQPNERCPDSSDRLEARCNLKDASTLCYAVLRCVALCCRHAGAEMPRAGDTEGCKAAGEKPRASNTQGCKAAGEGPRASNTEGYKAAGGRVPVTQKAIRRLEAACR
ncbi:hypothetical protein Bbelb_396540 [Branchiostoma belcheri]|nr:hypothetical protein Bbelb_396540 [Branchiostoma belcheri]